MVLALVKTLAPISLVPYLLVITGLTFLSISDTPGFGQKAAEPNFYSQFAGKNAAGSFVPGADFDGISGATITTNGVANIITEATKIGLEYLATI